MYEQWWLYREGEAARMEREFWRAMGARLWALRVQALREWRAR